MEGEPEPVEGAPVAEGEPESESPEAQPLAPVDSSCIEWIKAIVHLPSVELSWQPEHDEVLTEFVASPANRRLFIYGDPDNNLQLSSSVPVSPGPEASVMYVVKPAVALTAANIGEVVQYGTVNGSAIGSLLHLMSNVFVPRSLIDESWPDTIKKEFVGQMHRFMASLTETAWEERGTTTLYIPSETFGSVEEAAKQKDLVQRLESTLIHWTRQIKE